MGRHSATEQLLQQLAGAKRSAGSLERLLFQLQAELQGSPDVKTFERFIGGMALYFGNVFDAVASYGKIIQMRMDRNDPLQTYAQLMLDDAKAGKRLTEKLLHRKGITDLRLLTLDRFIRELAPLLSRIVAKRIKLWTARHAFR